ncbi:MAG TPA: hypothetical protein VN929_05915 [Burkholderiales bacterium]|nr:hypothetical protein [Burkholderiales bacterium]
MTQPQTEFLDLYRASLKSAVELMQASLEDQAKTIDSLVALQNRVAGEQFERAVGLWSELCLAAAENQAAALGQLEVQMAKARDWISQEQRNSA